jgi:sulfide dehydrogenase [flavocytochrome c] flavoprotein subunit
LKAFGRRQFLKAFGTGLAALGTGPIVRASPSTTIARVVVVGGGFGGATAAKYLRKWSKGSIEVILIDRNTEFVSCPVSNLVLGGSRTLGEITRSYTGLRRWGVKVVRDEATAVDPAKKRVLLKHAEDIPFDRLVLSPAVDLTYDQIEGYDTVARDTILSAWKAGPETVALRRQLEAMPDGGTFVIGVPRTPFRCPPGPYERACQAASYFRKAKPKSKVIILDANEDVASKGSLFKAAWNELYRGMVDYRSNSEVRSVDARAMVVKTDFDSIKGDVLNVLPPMQAGAVARNSGLLSANTRWCGVDWHTMESTEISGIHVLGDATLSAPAMPKSGHMANNQGKLAASAIIRILNDQEPDPQPVIANTCYSFVSDSEAIHIVSVHRYDPGKKTMLVVPGSSGVSPARSELEGVYGWAWAQNIWSDMLD